MDEIALLASRVVRPAADNTVDERLFGAFATPPISFDPATVKAKTDELVTVLRALDLEKRISEI